MKKNMFGLVLSFLVIGFVACESGPTAEEKAAAEKIKNDSIKAAAEAAVLMEMTQMFKEVATEGTEKSK